MTDAAKNRCRCGCNQVIPVKDSKGRPRSFMIGHSGNSGWRPRYSGGVMAKRLRKQEQEQRKSATAFWTT